MPDLGSSGFARKNVSSGSILLRRTFLRMGIWSWSRSWTTSINTPLGQVLKKIASLPEVRRQKVLHLRRQITEGKYDLSDRLDMALDKVLEDLIA